MRGTKAFRVCAGRHQDRAFTLIELLVVISILVMLMAILLPTLERVRRQAKATACLARVHQWGLAFKMYTDASGGRWFADRMAGFSQTNLYYWKTNIQNWGGLTAPYWFKTRDFAACPMATKGRGDGRSYDAFSAWFPIGYPYSRFETPSGEPIFGPISYGLNAFVSWPPPDDPRWSRSAKEVFWGISDVRGAGRIPVFFDSARDRPEPGDYIGPPMFDAGPVLGQIYEWGMCINRHDGGVNLLFMDWSARKVGLKELWTFKWHKRFDTAGVWTRQGGVEPADWPAWMRKFKDY